MGGAASHLAREGAAREQLKAELARAVHWEMDRYEHALRQPGACHWLALALHWLQNLLGFVESALRLSFHGCMWTLCYMLVCCTCAGESYRAVAQLTDAAGRSYAHPQDAAEPKPDKLVAIAYSGPALQLYHHTRMYGLYSWLMSATLCNVMAPWNPVFYFYDNFTTLERPPVDGYRPKYGCLLDLLCFCCKSMCSDRRILPEIGVPVGRLVQLLLFSFHPISGCHPAPCLGPCCCNTWANPRGEQGDVEAAGCRCCWDDWPERLRLEEQRAAELRIQATKKFYQDVYNVSSFDELYEVAKRSNSIPLANSRTKSTERGSGVARSSSGRPSVSVAVPVSQPALEA